MIDSIHQSMIGTALKCGEKFRRRYIEGEKAPAGIDAARGQGVHAASKVNLRQKVATMVDLPLSDMQDAARDGYVKSLQEGGVYLAPEDVPAKNRIINTALNDVISLTGLYAAEVAPAIQPVAVEERFALDVGLPIPMAGIMDYEQTESIGDLKTSGKLWTPGREKTELQAKLYSYVFEKKTGKRPRFDYKILVNKKKPELQTLSMVPTIQDYRAMLLTVVRFWQMVQSGVFLPADRGHWSCSLRWCNFYQTCRYVGNQHGKEI